MILGYHYFGMTTTVESIKGRRVEVEPLLASGEMVYIGRSCYMGGWKLPQSKWHNPFTVKKFGEKAFAMYQDYLRSKPELIKSLTELKGKRLACWCKDVKKDSGKKDLGKKKKAESAGMESVKKVLGDKPCHGDILAYYANHPNLDEYIKSVTQ